MQTRSPGSNGHPGTGNAKPAKLSTAAASVFVPLTGVAPSQGVHISATPPWWDVFGWGELAKAIILAIAGIAALAFAFTTGPTPVGVVAFLNGIDAFLHAAAFASQAIWGNRSGAYNVFMALAVAADWMVTVADAAFLLLLLTPLGAGPAVAEVTEPLLGNITALQAIYGFTGIDLLADITDFQSLT